MEQGDDNTLDILPEGFLFEIQLSALPTIHDVDHFAQPSIAAPIEPER